MDPQEYGWLALILLGPIEYLVVFWDYVAIVLMVAILAINLRRRMRRRF